MKKIEMRKAMAVLATLATFSAVAGEEVLKKPVDQLTEAERAERHRILQYRHTGGFITKREANPGMFAFVNTQKGVGECVFSDDVAEMCRICKIDYMLTNRTTTVTLANALEALKETRANAALFIVDDASIPTTLLFAPESRWGIVNIAALKKDSPDSQVLERRLRREIWRGFSIVAGSYTTETPHCVLAPVASLRDLDNIDGNTFSPEPLSRMEKNMRRFGIKPYYRCSYKAAVKQGWAPAPTNDVQKAVWEKVKADKERGPTNPITIPPPNAQK